MADRSKHADFESYADRIRAIERERSRKRPKTAPAPAVRHAPQAPAWLILLVQYGAAIGEGRTHATVEDVQLASALAAIDPKRFQARHVDWTWGPIMPAQAHAVGCSFPACSVCFTPWVPDEILQPVLDGIPNEMWPVEGDTPQSLAARLGESTWLDYLVHDGKPVNGNPTARQPRRKTYGVEVTAEHTDADGDTVSEMFRYEAPRRKNNACWKMPMPIWHLVLFVWRAALKHLPTGICQKEPPNSVQLLLYFGLLRSRMGRHRDMADTPMLAEALEKGIPKANSKPGWQQHFGTVTLVYTLERDLPMNCTLSYPPKENLKEPNRNNYLVHPLFQIPLRCARRVEKRAGQKPLGSCGCPACALP